jgi:hypothetical protein
MKWQAGLAGALVSVLMTCVAHVDVQIVSDRGRELSALYPTCQWPRSCIRIAALQSRWQ